MIAIVPSAGTNYLIIFQQEIFQIYLIWIQKYKLQLLNIFDVELIRSLFEPYQPFPSK